jgi:4-hydroxy-2-oxoheptanedioate aldolase
MNMRSSRVLQKLRAGEVVNCFKINLADSRAVEIASMSGFDCIWTCMEHVPNDWSTIEKQILAAKVFNTDVMVRVARGGYSDYIRPLEMDASGIMVPHIMNLEDAKNVIRMTRFHPIGRRPVDGGNADGAYCNIDFNDYLKQANEERFLCVQIEDPEPLDDLEAIASLEGIDIIFFGPGDFSQGIGAPGQWNHPKLLETRQRVAEICRAKGKFAGTVGSPANMNELVEMGYRFINLGADVVGLGQYCKDILTGIKQGQTERTKSIYGK